MPACLRFTAYLLHTQDKLRAPNKLLTKRGGERNIHDRNKVTRDRACTNCLPATAQNSPTDTSSIGRFLLSRQGTFSTLSKMNRSYRRSHSRNELHHSPFVPFLYRTAERAMLLPPSAVQGSIFTILSRPLRQDVQAQETCRHPC